MREIVNVPISPYHHRHHALISTLLDAKGFTAQLQIAGTAETGGKWIYAGYRLTVLSNEEEDMAKGLLNGGEITYLQTALERAGGQFSKAEEPFPAHVVTDQELITGQNPASAHTVARELLKPLE